MMRPSLVLLALVACGAPDPAPVAGDPTGWLVRASLDLRGVRPTPTELARLATADPADTIDAWLEDARFELRVRDLFARVWRTRAGLGDDYFFDGGGPYDLPQTPAFEAAVGEEPLVLLARVVAEDRPYTDLVTSPTTYVNGPLGKFYPVEYVGEVPEAATTWAEAVYVDGRPGAGALSSTGLWWRYTTTDVNLNRGRANAISRILLCSDFAARPVLFVRTAGDEVAEGEDRTRTDPTCLSCHAGLDPIGSALFGFASDAYTLSPYYSLQNEWDWASRTGVAPGYFGEPVADLAGLGVAIASDPRFLDCAVEQVYTGLYGIAADQADPAALARHRDAFLGDGARLKAVYRSILLDPAYREAPLRMLPIESLGAAVEDLTGYRWESDSYDMLGTDVVGLRILGGGMDGRVVTQRATAPSATTVLVAQRLAELAGPWAVAHDAERPAAEQLLPGIDFTEIPEADGPELEAAVAHLVRRTLGREPLDGEVSDLLETWIEARDLETVEAAWAALVVLLIRDPEFVLY